MRTTMGYSLERKEAVLKKMLPPNNQSIAVLAKMKIKSSSLSAFIANVCLEAKHDVDRYQLNDCCGIVAK